MNFKTDKQIDKIVDEGVKRIMKKRLSLFGGDPQKAFSNLEENPIYLNKESGITIKNVKVVGVNKAEPLHIKRDHFGKAITDEDGNLIPVDFVSTGNNHHIAIYKDENGKFQEQAVSFLDAVRRVNLGLPIIDRNFNNDIGWEFIFSLKQNEMFVFTNQEMDFFPREINLLDPRNNGIISPNLFRVQKIATKDYSFRHHLETTVDSSSELKGVTWLRLGVEGVKNAVKVRMNHLGEIVSVGEY